MQVFILDKNLKKSAKYYCDQHMKIILETAQILCTVIHLRDGTAPYKKTHTKHPWVLWANESLSNWKWLKKFNQVLNNENKYRTGNDHKSALIVKNLNEPEIFDKGLTPFPQAMDSIYKNDDVIKAYRKYYICTKDKFNKKGIAKWTNRPVPFFMRGE